VVVKFSLVVHRVNVAKNVMMCVENHDTISEHLSQKMTLYYTISDTHQTRLKTCKNAVFFAVSKDNAMKHL